MQIGRAKQRRIARACASRPGIQGFTLMEMVIVLAIIGILAAIVAPSVMSAMIRAREAALQQDLKIMRKLIDDYYGDKNAYPPSLKALAEQGYLKAIPGDPVNGNKAEWKAVPTKEGGISDVHSLSNDNGTNGVPYSAW
ncbi:MAG: type II secretion system protein [Rhodomicrobium sp.]